MIFFQEKYHKVYVFIVQKKDFSSLTLYSFVALPAFYF